MQAFRLQNFRGFRDTGWIELKPLTLLVGANSTGKSSLLRFLPLLRQSMATETGVPFAWAKEGGVDLGTAQDVHRRGATEPMRVGIWAATMDYLTSVKLGQGRSIEGAQAIYELTMVSKTPVGEVQGFTINAGRLHSRISISKEHHRVEGAFETNDHWLGPVAFRGGVIPEAIRLDSSTLTKIRTLVLSTVLPLSDNFTTEREKSLFSAGVNQSVIIRSLHLTPHEFKEMLEEVILPGQRVTMGEDGLAGVQTQLWDLTLGALLSDLRSSLTFEPPVKSTYSPHPKPCTGRATV